MGCGASTAQHSGEAIHVQHNHQAAHHNHVDSESYEPNVQGSLLGDGGGKPRKSMEMRREPTEKKEPTKRVFSLDEEEDPRPDLKGQKNDAAIPVENAEQMEQHFASAIGRPNKFDASYSDLASPSEPVKVASKPSKHKPVPVYLRHQHDAEGEEDEDFQAASCADPDKAENSQGFDVELPSVSSITFRTQPKRKKQAEEDNAYGGIPGAQRMPAAARPDWLEGADEETTSFHSKHKYPPPEKIGLKEQLSFPKGGNPISNRETPSMGDLLLLDSPGSSMTDEMPSPIDDRRLLADPLQGSRVSGIPVVPSFNTSVDLDTFGHYRLPSMKPLSGGYGEKSGAHAEKSGAHNSPSPIFREESSWPPAERANFQQNSEGPEVLTFEQSSESFADSEDNPSAPGHTRFEDYSSAPENTLFEDNSSAPEHTRFEDEFNAPEHTRFEDNSSAPEYATFEPPPDASGTEAGGTDWAAGRKSGTEDLDSQEEGAESIDMERLIKTDELGRLPPTSDREVLASRDGGERAPPAEDDFDEEFDIDYVVDELGFGGDLPIDTPAGEQYLSPNVSVDYPNISVDYPNNSAHLQAHHKDDNGFEQIDFAIGRDSDLLENLLAGKNGDIDTHEVFGLDKDDHAIGGAEFAGVDLPGTPDNYSDDGFEEEIEHFNEFEETYMIDTSNRI